MQQQIATALRLRAAVSQGNSLFEKLLASLQPHVSEMLLSQATLRDVAEHETVLESGIRSPEVVYVLEGTLAMAQILEDGRKHIVGLLVPTDTYGRLFDGPSNYRIEALTAAQVLAFPRALFEQILHDNPEAERLFLLHLLDEVDAAREWLLLISGRKAVNRLASFLNILLRRSKLKRCGPPAVLHVPFSRKDLAHYLGARRETLSRAFHELERKGVLEIVDPYRFRILDEEGLVAASGDDLTLPDD